MSTISELIPKAAKLALSLNASLYRNSLFKRMREYDKNVIFRLNKQLAKQTVRLAKHKRAEILDYDLFYNNAAMYFDAESSKLCNQFEPLNDIEQMIYLTDMLETICFDLFQVVFEDDPDSLHDLCKRRY